MVERSIRDDRVPRQVRVEDLIGCHGGVATKRRILSVRPSRRQIVIGSRRESGEVPSGVVAVAR